MFAAVESAGVHARVCWDACKCTDASSACRWLAGVTEEVLPDVT